MGKLIKYIIWKLLNKINNYKFYTNNIFLSIRFENFIAFIRKKDIRFSYNKRKHLIKAEEKGLVRYYEDPIRCFWLYRNGIRFRGKFIHKTYCIEKINFSKEDIVIDCGANSGDFFIELKDHINSTNYIGIEPNPSDFKILNLNCLNTTLINKALGKEKSVLDFFIATREGNSSLIEPREYQSVKKVEVISLQELMNELQIKKVKILKLEAEGFEPEILSGIGNRIKDIEYIAVDGGNERGKKEEQTFTICTNFLINNGFEISDIYFSWYRALFRNLNFSNID